MLPEHRVRVGSTVLPIVILVVRLGQADDPTTRATLNAAREATGQSVPIRVEERSDPDAEPPLDPGAAEVAIAWNANSTSATIRLRGAGPNRRHRVDFSPADEPEERGRTLGYVLASMLPQGQSRHSSTGARAEPAPQHSRVAAGVPLRPVTRRIVPLQFELTAAGTASLGTLADEIEPDYGGTLGLGWRANDWLVLGGALEARAGNIDEAQATTLWLAAKTGAEVAVLRLGSPPVLEVGLRADLGIGRMSVTQFNADDASSRSSQWTGVVDGRVEATWWIQPRLGLLLGAGLDLVFSRTDVYLGDDLQASMGPARPLLEVGVHAQL
jgi:hypothetical protein